MYEARILPEAMRNLVRVPDKAKHAATALISGPLSENPHRSGKPLVW